MKYLMTLFLVFTACGKGGGGSDASSGGTTAPPTAPPVVDTTPHIYTLSIYNLDSAVSYAPIVMVCDFGLPTVRTFNLLMSNTLPAISDAIGCGPASNVTIDVSGTNVSTGADQVYVEISIDWIMQPSLEKIMSSGQTYHFQRGF